jgi:hypothetical protein
MDRLADLLPFARLEGGVEGGMEPVQGFDQVLAVHYLSPFFCTNTSLSASFWASL